MIREALGCALCLALRDERFEVKMLRPSGFSRPRAQGSGRKVSNACIMVQYSLVDSHSLTSIEH